MAGDLAGAAAHGQAAARPLLLGAGQGRALLPPQVIIISANCANESYLVLMSANYCELCSRFRRDMRESFKSKGNCLVSVLAANVLNAAFQVNFLIRVACLPVM